MAVDVVLLRSMRNGNPYADVPRTTVKNAPFIDVGMKGIRTTVLQHNFVVLAVVHVDIHEMDVGLSPTLPSVVF